jgi:hypothetical protein
MPALAQHVVAACEHGADERVGAHVAAAALGELEGARQMATVRV